MWISERVIDFRMFVWFPSIKPFTMRFGKRLPSWAAATRHAHEVLSKAAIPHHEANITVRECRRYVLQLDASRGLRLRLTHGQNTLWRRMLRLRTREHVPLQYIIHEWDFLDVTLKQKRPILIPRPETEVVAAMMTKR